MTFFMSPNFMSVFVEEILIELFSFVNDGYTYKSVVFTCKKWNSFMKINYPEKRNKVCNHLLTLLQKYPNKPWNWCNLSANPNITIDIVEKYSDKWNWYWLSLNPNITFDIVDKYLDKPWSWDNLSVNKYIKHYCDKVYL